MSTSNGLIVPSSAPVDPLQDRNWRNRVMQLSGIGYGWEDICVRENLHDPFGRAMVREMVLSRTWRGVDARVAEAGVGEAP